MAKTEKRIILLGFGTPEEIEKNLTATKKKLPRHIFETLDLMWKTLTPRRQELLQAMAGKEAMPIRTIARMVGRDVKAIHNDVQTLLAAGLLAREENKILFPYDGFCVDYVMKAVEPC